MKRSPDEHPRKRISIKLGQGNSFNRRYRKGVKGLTFSTRDLPPSRYPNYNGITFEDQEEDGFRIHHFLNDQVGAVLAIQEEALDETP